MAEANAEAIAALPSGGVAVVPAAGPLDPYLARDDIDHPPFRVRRRPAPRSGDALLGRTATVDLELPFTQRHLVSNTLAALHAYDALGLPLDRAAEGVAGIVLSPWRGEEIPLPGGGFVVNDAYNANPDSMRAALEHLAERAGERRKVAVLGEMAELGETLLPITRRSASSHAELGVDVIGVGEASRAYTARAGQPTPQPPSRARAWSDREMRCS